MGQSIPTASLLVTKMGGVADTPEGYAAMQGEWLHNELKTQAERNLVQCKVLHPGMNNSMYQHMLGVNWLESSFTEKKLGMPLDSKLNISQQRVLMANKVNGTLGTIRQSTASRPR